MSSETSPHHPTALGNPYATPITSTPHTAMHPSGPGPNSAPSGPFADSTAAPHPYDDHHTAKTEPYQPDNGDNSGELPTPTPTKGKNGATGPAEGKIKPHVCQICQRAFTTGGHLQRHQRIHTGVKAFKCPFPGCETRTSRQDNLQQHYRTHLSPTLRRGSGSAARAAVAQAMEAAGLKSTNSRAPRKSKGSAVGTPSSAGGSHVPSPYQTPTSQGPSPYAPYGMYDPSQQHYPYPLPPPNMAMQTQSGASSRVPSPVNGHSSSHSSVGSMPHQHQQYFAQPFSPAYGYPGQGMHQQPYRYGPQAIPSPYGAPHAHHGIYSPGIASEHGGQGHMYSPMNTQFGAHSRESSYGVLTPQYGAQGAMGNGTYPPRTQTSTPLSQNHDDDHARAYGRAPPPAGHRPPSPRRRTPPHDLLGQGVVDPASMNRSVPGMGGYGAPGAYGQAPPMAYGGYGMHGATRDPGIAHRASISSLSDGGSGNGGSDGSKRKFSR